MRRGVAVACVVLFSRTTSHAFAADAVSVTETNAASAVGAEASRAVTPELESAIAFAASAPQFGTWRGTSFGAILPPDNLDVDDSGGFDVAFHFHAAMMAERDWRVSNANVVVASATYGIGSGVYADAFASPARFGQTLREIASVIEQRPAFKGQSLHVRRVTLVAWSAGFAAVAAILSVPANYDRVDSVVLLDGLHAPYTHPEAGNGQGEAALKPGSLVTFTRFAQDALANKKTFVMTHSSIVPPGYASTTECVGALLHALGADLQESEPVAGERSSLVRRFDRGNLHARGFTGTSQPAHIDHLHMVGAMMRDYVIPERLARTPRSDEVALSERREAE